MDGDFDVCGMSLSEMWRLLDGTRHLRFIFLANEEGDEISERQPSFLEAAQLALSIVSGAPFETFGPYHKESGPGPDDEDRRMVEAVVEELKRRPGVTFCLAWHWSGDSDPRFEHSSDQTWEEAIHSVSHFLQHDLAWAISSHIGE